LVATHGRAQEVGFIERYALSTNRDQVLAELIPGTADYYYFHCLHYQVSQRLADAQAMLDRWQAHNGPNGDGRLRGILQRQMLLTYGDNPQRTLDFIRSELGLNLQHEPPVAPGERRLPSQLDQSLIDPERALDEAVRNFWELTPAGRHRLAAKFLEQNDYSPDVLTNLLQTVTEPGIDRLDQLVIAELRRRPAQERMFGDRAAHQHLTRTELEAVRTAFPELGASESFVNAYLRCLRPNDDMDVGQQPEAWRRYLQSVDAYVDTLPPAFNSLKACVLFQLLQADRVAGQLDQQRFLRYLRLPRNGGLVAPVYLQRISQQQPIAQLEADFTQQCLCPPIGHEEELVRAYLEAFLRTAENTKVFDGLLTPDYLRRVFAETKLLAGVGNSDQWFAMLDPGARRALQDRVEVTLALTNPAFHAPDQPSALEVDLKNVEQLTVRIYQINAESYYRAGRPPLSSAIDLDGLQANVERTLSYSYPAIRRHRERIELPELSGRGIWVVDLLGGGQRSRAFIRRGDLRWSISSEPRGHALQVVDERAEPLPHARLWLGTQELKADEYGVIAIPYAAETVQRTAVLSDGPLATQVNFLHEAEQYALLAAFHVHRQQLRTGQPADLVIRPNLLANQRPASLALLKNVQLTVMATDQEGSATTKRYEDLKLNDADALVQTIRVPPRLASLQVILSGQVDNAASGTLVPLSVSTTWTCNDTERTDQVVDFHLALDQQSWVLEAIGRNGEPVRNLIVGLTFATQYRTEPVRTSLQTDDLGHLQLGPMLGVTGLTADGAGVNRSWPLLRDQAPWPPLIHSIAGQPVLVPAGTVSGTELSRWRLWDLRQDLAIGDFRRMLSIDSGRLKIEGLAPGDYELRDIVEPRRTRIRVTTGPVVQPWIYGSVRQLQQEARKPLGIRSLNVVDGQLVVELSGGGSETRVYVFGSRYLPPQQPGEALGLSGGPLSAVRHGLPRSFYQSDRRLAEEYQYVLRRRQTKAFPGNLLPHPSLILNPWQTDVTENVLLQALEGEALAEQMAPPAASAPGMAVDRPTGEPITAMTSSLEFLPDEGLVLLNLRPDANGRLVVPANLLEGVSLLQVVACDPLSWIQQSISKSLDPLEARDRRLIQPLDANQYYARRQAVLVATPDRPVDLSALSSARVQTYTTIGELYTLFGTLLGDARWSEFAALARWHTLTREQKETAYGRLASHELHTFLKYKDREFFDSVVRPYLANKDAPSLVDRWLLDQPLTAPELWAYDRSNAFERALVGRLLVAERSRIVREYQERLENRKEDPQVVRRRMSAALLGEFMDAERGAVSDFAYFDAQGQAPSGVANEAYAMGFEAGKPMRDALAGGLGAGGIGGGPFGVPGGGGGTTGESVEELRRLADQELKLDSKAKDRRDLARRFREEAAIARDDAENALSEGRQWMMRGRSLEKLGAAMYRPLEATTQWAESYYDRVRRNAEREELIPLNRFWQDFLLHEGEGPFVSEHVLEPVTTRAEALIALSLIGLPLQSSLELPSEQDAVAWRPTQPVLIVSEQLQRLTAEEGRAPVLVGQRFEPLTGDPAEQETAAPREFLTGQGYRGLIVLTNPSPQPRQVSVLWQIPAGSLPLASGRATDSRVLELPAFATERLEYHFYFPSAGTFMHYPACVSHDDKALAKGEALEFRVVDQPTEIDAQSWRHVAEKGTATQIKEFLSKHNLRKLDWSLVLHRLPDRTVYDVVLEVLDANELWVPEAWAYSVRHNDGPRLRQFLNHQESLVQPCGPVFQSALLTIEPIERVLYEHLEYSPLVVARVHPLRDRTEITNDRLLTQYRQLMGVLAYQSAPTIDQQLALCYYFLLQQRIAEALSRFASVDRGGTEMQLQYDYLDAYLSLYREDYERAGALAEKHAGHPVPRWRERFGELKRQLAQRAALLAGGSLPTETTDEGGVPLDAADLSVLDRDRIQADRAAKQPAASLTFDGSTLVIDHTQLASAKVQLYRMDLELLFSFTPFVKQDLGQLAMIAPNRVEELPLSSATGQTRWRLPDELAGQALLVEIVGPGLRETVLYYGSQLATYVAEPFGQLQVLTSADRKPVVGAYVKVYARHADGTERFYKDGYTDLRGRFDYASLSASDAETAQRFAILVLGPQGGATLHEVNPPPR